MRWCGFSVIYCYFTGKLFAFVSLYGPLANMIYQVYPDTFLCQISRAFPDQDVTRKPKPKNMARQTLNEKLAQYHPLYPSDDTADFLRIFFKYLPLHGQVNLAEDVDQCSVHILHSNWSRGQKIDKRRFTVCSSLVAFHCLQSQKCT